MLARRSSSQPRPAPSSIRTDWYLSIVARSGIAFQIAGQAFRGAWREPQGEERARIWDFMGGLCPPFLRYQAATRRLIPLLLLKPIEPIEIFKP